MRAKRILLGIIFSILVGVSIEAQQKPQILIDLSEKDKQSGQIEIIQSSQIENLLSMQIYNNRLQEGIPGFRIIIFSQAGQQARERSIQARATFVRNYPDIEVYHEYIPPNFRVLVGNFRTRNEALRELKQIERSFPRAFIVRANIQIN